MKRIVLLISIALFQIEAYAQRGRVRPEWDIESSHSYHSVDDDLYSFLLIIGVIVIVFIYGMIKGSSKKSTQGWDNNKKSSDSIKKPDYNGGYIKMGYTSKSDIDNDEPSLTDGEQTNKDIVSHNEWSPFGKAKTLKEIWDEQYPGLYDRIDGNLADVIPIEFATGEVVYRISIPLKDGKTKELKLAKSELEVGDKVDISTIVGIELRKKGHSSIIRYHGELFYSTEASAGEIDLAPKDRYGIKYSSDSKRLLYASPSIDSFSIRKTTVVICDKAFFMCKNLVSVIIPKGIRKIGNEAFSFCPALESIELPDSIFEIGKDVFAGCDALSYIKIEKGTRSVFEKLLPDYADLLVEEVPESNGQWEPDGDAFALKEIWEACNYDKYEDIDGNVAEVISIESEEGNYFLRIKIPFKDGSSVELKLSPISELEEGDKVDICTIVGQEFHKKGHAPIVRYDGEPYLSTEVTKEDLANAWTDKFGVKYSKDRKRLFETPEFKDEYSYSDQWLASMYGD